MTALSHQDCREWLVVLVRNVYGAADRADLLRGLRGEPSNWELELGFRIAFDELLAERVLVVKLTNPMSKKKPREPGVFIAPKPHPGRSPEAATSAEQRRWWRKASTEQQARWIEAGQPWPAEANT